MKKSRILAIALAVLVLCSVVGGTYAYFTAEDKATNVITTGGVEVEVEETMIDENGDEVPFEDQENITPGGTVSKIVRIKCDGPNAVWVRVKIATRVTLENGTVENEPAVVSLDYNTTDWQYLDGYWYYLKPLAAGESAEPLFKNVYFSPDMGNEYVNAKFEIDVLSYAVQYDNNGSTVFEATGWPE